MTPVAVAAALLLLAVPLRPFAQAPAPSSSSDLVGTWTLGISFAGGTTLERPLEMSATR